MSEQESAYQPTRGIPPRETKAGKEGREAQIEQPHLCGLLLKPVDGPLVDAPTFVDEMPRCGGLARIHVADDHNVDVGLLFAHAGSCSERRGVLSA